MYEGHPSTWSERRRSKAASLKAAAAAPNEATTAAAQAAHAAAKQTSVDDVKEINKNELHHLLREILDREKQNEELLKKLRHEMGDVSALMKDMICQVADMNHQVNKMEKTMESVAWQKLSAVSDQDSDK